MRISRCITGYFGSMWARICSVVKKAKSIKSNQINTANRAARARIHPIFAKNTYSSCATRIYLYLSRQDIGTSIIANTGVTGVFSIDPFVQINTTMAIQKSKYRISSSRSTDFTRVSLLPLLLNFFLVSVILHTTRFCLCYCWCATTSLSMTFHLFLWMKI